ncbi:MAG: Gfo/Idh/MocA family protein [Planctomycetaceae bacterium]
MGQTDGRRSFLQTTAAGLFAVPQSVAGSSSNRIRIGQIGTQHAHASKLSVYRSSSDYEVVGVVEPDDALRARAADSAVYRDLPWMTQEQLLNTPGLQAVLVETEVCDSLNTAEACVAAGKHIHLDKPAGQSLAQFERILKAVEEQQLMLQMGYMYRYNPAVVLLQRFLQQGWLGEIFEVHTVMSKVVPAGSRKQLAEYPGGIMFELGCHILDLVIGILGAPQQVSQVIRGPLPEGDNLRDNMLAVLEYDKAIATIKSSALEVDGFRRRHLTVCGTGGTFHIQPLDQPAVGLSLDRPRGEWKKGFQEISLPKYTRYVDDAADMAAVIRGERPNRFPPSHDLIVQRTLLEACEIPHHLV